MPLHYHESLHLPILASLRQTASFAGFSITVTNAPHVDYLDGTSLQAGGSLDLDLPWGLFAEAIIIPSSEQEVPYFGTSIGGVGTYPDPIPGSIHGSVETGQVIWIFEPKAYIDDMQKLLYGTGGQ